MAKTRASFLKRQREMAKKEQRQAKLRRKAERKAGAAAGPPIEEPSAPPVDSEPVQG